MKTSIIPLLTALILLSILFLIGLTTITQASLTGTKQTSTSNQRPSYHYGFSSNTTTTTITTPNNNIIIILPISLFISLMLIILTAYELLHRFTENDYN